MPSIIVGNYKLPDRGYLEDLIARGVLKEYDMSPELREAHDVDAIFNKDGIKIKCTREEIQEYWSKILNS
jgi:hypothetical protein